MISKHLAFLIFNFTGLQVTWAACAYGATHALPLLGVYVGLAYIVAHFIFSKLRIRDLKIMLIVGLLGIAIDSIFTQFNLLSFPEFTNQHLPIPAWLIVLWFVFALMVPYSLYWLRKNLKIASIAGALGGSLSYLLGHILGALHFAEPIWITFMFYFIEWGLFFPLALLITKYFTNTQLDAKTTDSAF